MDCCRGEVLLAVTLETQIQCGNSSARQCWDTQACSSTISQSLELPAAVYLTTSATAWSEMANRGYSGSNVMLVRNESSNDVSLVAMLASCSPVALQG